MPQDTEGPLRTAENGLKSIPCPKMYARLHFLESMKTIPHLFLKLALMIHKHQKVLESSCHESVSKKQWKQVHEFKPNYSSSIRNNAKDMCKDAHMVA